MGDHAPVRPTPPEAALTDDPDLWLVHADPGVWDAAHPCTCVAMCLCVCEES